MNSVVIPVSEKAAFSFAKVTAISLQRPLATLMFFLGLTLLGLFSWYKVPVELLPSLEGERMYVRFSQIAASPQSLERQVLIPIESRIRRLSGIKETKGEIDGSSGSLEIQFETGVELKASALELQNIVADMRRTLPSDIVIEIGSQNFNALTQFVMSLQVSDTGQLSNLGDIVEQRVSNALLSVPGVSRALVVGAGQREISVLLDMEQLAQLKLSARDVIATLEDGLQGITYLGDNLSYGKQLQILIDTRVTDLKQLKDIAIDPERNILLRHVAKVSLANQSSEGVYRVNGKDSIGVLVFKEDGANLMEIGRALKIRIEQLNQQLTPFGLQIHCGFDASNLVTDVLERLKLLALLGFIIALFVLYVFLKQVRAVITVAVAVPISLLTAGALLYLSGQTLNIITLFGLSIGIGMLVDNSIVVYEAVHRGLERGMNAHKAAITGIQRTIKAIIASTATNAVVFLPLVMFVDDALIQQLVKVIAAAILLPLVASLLVAITLVPLLTREMAKVEWAKKSDVPQAKQQQRRLDLGRELFAALFKISLRNPTALGIRMMLLFILTIMITIPVVLMRSIAPPATDASEIKFELVLDGGSTLEATSLVFSRLEGIVALQPGVSKTESHFFEDEGSLTVYFDTASDTNGTANAQMVRKAVDNAVREMNNVQLKVDDEAGNSISFDFEQGNSERIALSGQDMRTLRQMAEYYAEKLESRPEIANVSVMAGIGANEVSFGVDPVAAMFYGLESNHILNSIYKAGREGQQLFATYSDIDGREVPITVLQTNSAGRSQFDKLDQYSIATAQGAVPVSNFLKHKESLPSPVITYRDGQRELSVYYRFKDKVAGNNIDEAAKKSIAEEVVSSLFIPSTYSVTHHAPEDQIGKFARVYLPVLLLLFVVLTLTFESLTLPLLVLLTIPMTLVGALWGLFIGGFGIELMALVGIIVLFGLAINPAILLIEGIQDHARQGHLSFASAAMMAVRERTRPVLATTCTTIGGLWPMTLVTGKEMEIWPAFAAVLMGGVAISTFLTLLVIPVAYVLVSRFERNVLTFTRGQWMWWMSLSFAAIFCLVHQNYMNHSGWQVFNGLVIFGLAYWLVSRTAEQRSSTQEFDPAIAGESSLESRYIGKTYDQPGALSTVWRRYGSMKQHVSFTAQEFIEKGCVQLLLAGSSFYLSQQLTSSMWVIMFTYIAGLLLCFAIVSFYQIYRPASVSNVSSKLLLLLPWLVLVYMFVSRRDMGVQDASGVSLPILALLFTLTTITQYGRRCAIAITQGRLDPEVEGRFALLRSSWRRFCILYLGLDIRQPGFVALHNVNFKVGAGMVGLLGPNGAGKTTFLRIIASVLKPTTGTLRFFDRDARDWGDGLAGMIGYLPQIFGLYDHMSAKEYLEYFAGLYRVGNKQKRSERVDYLLEQVGLEHKRQEKLGSFSGGMRQRVAVARTLLRLPPILVVDEPTVGLDSTERIRFRNLLAKLARDRIVLFSTHVVEDVAISCNRALVLRAGRIVYDGSPQDLADVAKDKVWTLQIHENELPEIERKYKVVTQINDGQGLVRLRLIASSVPHTQAKAEEPALEDGYLCLLGTGEN